MREIPLSGGNVALVDDEDYPLLAAHAWSATPNKSGNWYAKRLSKGPEGEIINIYMHRQILDLGPDEIADHKDRYGLNNQRENLRRCTYSLNAAAAFYPVSTSGYRGVYRDRNKFRAQATCDRKTVNIGTFDEAAEAARAQDAFVFKLYGEFAVLNFPVGGVQ